MNATVYPPGPGEPSFVQAIRFGKDPVGFLTDCAARYGHCFTLRLPGDSPKVACSHPDDVRKIFALKAEDFTAANLPIPLSLGRGSLLFLDGNEHLADRKLLVPLLVGERLGAYGELIKNATDEVLLRWTPGYRFRPQDDMQQIALTVIIQCVFGISDSARTARVRTLIADWLKLALSPPIFLLGQAVSPVRLRRFLDRAADKSQKRFGEHPPYWRMFPWQRLVDLKGALQAILLSEVQRCRTETAADRADILALLTTARYEDGTALRDDQIIDHLITLLIGGHETTANSLGFALGHMLAHPEVIRRVQTELAAVMQDGGFDVSRLPQLHYLHACIQESMRLSPVTVALARQLLKPLELSCGVVPAGSSVWACPSLTQRSSSIWTDSAEFRPERFLNEDSNDAGQEPAKERERPREAFYPFGGGRRRCPGMPFAYFEMRVVLARIFSCVSLSLTPESRLDTVLRGVSLGPADGLSVVVTGPAGLGSHTRTTGFRSTMANQ